MARTLAEWLAGATLRWRLRSRIRAPRPATRKSTLPSSHAPERTTPVTIPFLDGYKTYLIAAAMVVVGLSQLLGVDIPSFDGRSAGQLIMEAFAIIFLRRGIKGMNG